MVVQSVSNMAHLQNIFTGAGKKLIVIDFYADWCGPCKFIAPYMEELSTEFASAIFLKVNVDHSRDIAGHYKINAMPTFVFISEKQEIDRMQGASKTGLHGKISGWVNYLGTSAPAVANPKAANAQEKVWLQRFVPLIDMMHQYEDEVAQTLARSLFPLEDFQSQVTVDGHIQDFELTKLLLKWFKEEFFSWTNQPVCEGCGTKASAETRSNGFPTEDERENGAGRVEVYQCLNCKKEVRFPRYNNPIKLLETRNGRCGEWANCFALFCRSAGLETRYVTDNADHVWVEVWAEEKRRWVHCDPCENVIDVPLMYEKGWKKKLAYVFAFAKDHCMDVTWRYTFNRKQTTKRRNKCRTLVLLNFFNKLNSKIQKELPEDRKKVLKQRYLSEAIEFLWPWNNLRKKESAEHQGRSSGSEHWKLQRGEAGASGSSQKVTITLSQKEIDAKAFEITYNTAANEYIRTNDPESSTKNWESQVFEATNMFRKVESDWNKAYLARTEDSDLATIAWKVDLTGQKVKNVSVNATSFKTGSGFVKGTVCCGMQCQRIPPDGAVQMEDLGEAEYLEIHLEIGGGDGDAAWQHSQLFRSDLTENDPGLSIRVEFV